MAADAIRPGGLTVLLHNEDIWRELRASAQVPDHFVNDGWSMEHLRSGGGKGGSLMARVGDAFIVKELSKGDHGQLLWLAASYAEHVRAGESLLSPIYLHFSDAQSGRHFFVMGNTVGGGQLQELYDLKGCADDKTLVRDGAHLPAVHKRIWNVSMWLGRGFWSEARIRYYNGKLAARGLTIPLGGGEKGKVLARLERDVAWLKKNGLMDYSLLVAVGASDGGKGGPPATGQQCFTRPGPDGSALAVRISIIDFFQGWTNGKKVAMVLKAMERNKATVPPEVYGERFRSHFAGRITEEAPPSTVLAHKEADEATIEI